MNPFLALVLASAVSYGINRLASPGQPQPDQPWYIPPDPTMLREFGDFNDWQNEERSKMLAEYYGGVASYNPINSPYSEWNGSMFDAAGNLVGEGYGTRELTTPTSHTHTYWGQGIPRVVTHEGPPHEGSDQWNDYNNPTDPSYRNTKELEKFNPALPNGRWETSFTGTKPAEEYLGAQNYLISRADESAAGDIKDYFSKRGMDAGRPGSEVVWGAAKEFRKDNKQRYLDINAKAHDIYAQTLATLTGEVSDTGGQMGQLSANIGMANQGFNQAMQQSYQQAMQQWQYNQQNPQFSPLMMLGQIMPYAINAYGQQAPPTQYAYNTGSTPYGLIHY